MFRFVPLLSAVFLSLTPLSESFSSRSLKTSRRLEYRSPSILSAKRNKNNKGDDDNLNQWYDSVDEDATPDEVFWEEMDRQRLFNQIGQESTNDPYAVASAGSSSSTSAPSSPNSNMMGGGKENTMNGSPPINSEFSTGGISSSPPMQPRKAPTMDQQKATEATLSEYALYQVEDNWLDEELQEQMESMQTVKDSEDLSIEEETTRLEEQLEALPDGYGDQRDLLWETEEPWDDFGDEHDEDSDLDRKGIRQVPEPSPGMYIITSRINLKCDSNS